MVVSNSLSDAQEILDLLMLNGDKRIIQNIVYSEFRVSNSALEAKKFITKMN
jgi:hypothetical protein